MRHRRALVAGLAMATGVLLLVQPPASAQARSQGLHRSLTIRHQPPIRHERLTMTGTLPGGPRPFVLERRTRAGWSRVAHGTTVGAGYFTILSQHVGVSRATYRVLAPAHGDAPKVRTRAHSVRPVRQQLTLTAPTTAETGARIEVGVQVTPARTGRRFLLQQSLDGAWVTRVSTRATDLGLQTLDTVPAAAGPLHLRVVADESDGARRVIALAPVIEVSDPAPGAVSALAAAPFRTGIRLTWTPSWQDYQGATVRRAAGTTPPATPSDGVAVATSAIDTVDDVGLDPGTTYSYAVFPHNAAAPVGYGPVATITATTPPLPAWQAATPLPSAEGAGTLHDWVSISCPSDHFCTAVNLDGSVSRFDGTSWSAPALIGDGAPTSVSCPTTDFCAAFGSGKAFTWNGSDWTATSLTTGGQWYSVSCASASFCVAVDAGSDAFTWNGSTWSAPTAFRPTSEVAANNNDVNTISCPTSTFCVTVGSKGMVHTFDGASWSGPTTISNGHHLYGISCASASLCVATSSAQGEASVWNGTSWTAPTTLRGSDPQADVEMYAASCTTADACIVSNRSGENWRLTDGAWVRADTDVPVSTVNSISCPSSDFCAAIGFPDVALYR